MVNTNISDKLGGNIHIKKNISNKKNTSRSDSYNKYLNDNKQSNSKKIIRVISSKSKSKHHRNKRSPKKKQIKIQKIRNNKFLIIFKN